MLKEFAQYLVSLKGNKTYTIHGDTYSDRELVRIDPHVDRPHQVSVNRLDSIVKLLWSELDMSDNLPMFVRVGGARKVSVFSTHDSEMCQDNLYEMTYNIPGFQEGFQEQEKAIIELRSKFMPGKSVDYLLDLLSRINKKSGVTTWDNGVSRKVEARQGVSLRTLVQVKPRTSIWPYRIFLEVEQPRSEFILRLDKDGDMGLFKANGGMWKMQAKASIVAYFEEKLADEVNAGKVIVMM